MCSFSILFVKFRFFKKVLQFIIDKYPDIEIQYTKHGNPKPGTFDMCDSIVIALAGDKLVREAQTT